MLNATTGKKERIGRLLRMHANSREERDVCQTGADPYPACALLGDAF